MNLETIGQNARQAARRLALASRLEKDSFLSRLAGLLQSSAGQVLEANAMDVTDGEEDGLSSALLDRLTLNSARLEGIASDLVKVAGLPDPVGEIFDASVLPNGLKIHKQRVPLGVVAAIYEARPNVTIDIIGLVLKTGNAVILRGGSETLRTNRLLVELASRALAEIGLPVHSVQFIDDTDRQLVLELLQMQDYIDMLIPRGGAGLHRFCRENSRIPVITGGIGICHLFVDRSADLEAALPVIYNAKTQRPSVCNALDTVLVHQDVAPVFLPRLVSRLAPAGVTFRAEPRSLACLRDGLHGTVPDSVNPASPDDYDTEWLSLVLSLKTVSGLEEAIAHIQQHSTGHSDGILTGSDSHASQFIAQVDSAAVYVNASTRFTDGGQFGLGAEVAVSTQRLHARGPLGLRELTTYKWVVQGDYHVRA
jgi:glutamate-5-semialdehyde dehydrogenase